MRRIGHRRASHPARLVEATHPHRAHVRLRLGSNGAVWLATAALFAVSAVVAPGTVRPASLFAMLPYAEMLAVVAIGQTLVIQQRGLDLSAGGMMTLGGMVAAVLIVPVGSLLAVFATLLLALLLGTANGLLIARLGIMPIVATLATNALFAGAVRTLSGGSPIAVSGPLATVLHPRWGGVPASAELVLLFVAAVAIAMRHLPLGRRFVAVGANPRAAAAAGIPVVRYQIGAYAAATTCFALAGMLSAGFLGSASHTAGDNYLLASIAAVVIGGTSLAGGRGSVVGSSVAALFMAQLEQVVLALGASAALQLLVQAAAILLAASLRSLWVRAGAESAA